MIALLALSCDFDAPPPTRADPVLYDGGDDDTGSLPHDGSSGTGGGGGGGPGVDTDPPAVVRRVFVTSTTTTGSDLGGRAGADALCQAHAAALQDPGTFVAWLAVTGDEPWVRIPTTPDAVWALPGVDTVVAKGVGNWVLGTGLLAAIDRDENGAQVVGSDPVWTGMVRNRDTFAVQPCPGTQPDALDDWDDTSPLAAGVGRVGRSDTAWQAAATLACVTQPARLYCLELP